MSVFGDSVNACNYPIMSNLNKHGPNTIDRAIRDIEINDEFTTTLNCDDNRNELRLNTNKVVHDLKSLNLNSENVCSRLNVEEDIRLNIRNELIRDDNIAKVRNKSTNNEINDEHVTRRHKSRKENLKPRSKIFINPYPEHNQLLTERPGRQYYHEELENSKITAIFTDSISNAIKVREFNEDYHRGTALFRRFPGSKSKQMRHVIPTLVESKPDVCLIHVGTNDLPTKKDEPSSIEKIANDIIQIGVTCKAHGTEEIIISNVILRKSAFYLQKRRSSLNTLLSKLCRENGFKYLDNNNIIEEHLAKDNLHLNPNGGEVLRENFLNMLNNLF